MLPDTEKDVRTRAPLGVPPDEPHLFVVLEGARPMAGGLRCSLRGVDEVVLGRDDARVVERRQGRLSLHLPDRKISSRHARLLHDRGGWRIEDLGSTNGTSVNGRRVDRDRLGDGDVIEIGQSVLRLRLSLATPPGAPEVTVGDASALRLTTLLPALAGELALLERVARSSMPVLLLGETGTGKEVAARAVHAVSSRPGELVVVNCAALPESHVEAQLFGYAKGALSGAMRDEVGFVRRAHEGTLFLDEIGDLPRGAQGALLRVLQEGEVVPIGATRAVAVQARVIASTHQPIEAMVERGEFRRDLFARLQGFTHRLWPLAERREDLGSLIAEWLAERGGASAEDLVITSEASRALLAHAFPLNVRELVQVLTHALALCEEGVIDLGHLPASLAAPRPRRSPRPEAPDSLSREEATLRAELVTGLERHAGNVAAVARDMKKAPMQIYRWMQRLGIDPKVFR